MPKDSEQTSSLPIAAMLKRGELSILVVEDDKFLRELLVSKLKREGFTVLEAVNGEDGLQSAFENKPHVVILDLVLPGMGGFEVMGKLSDNENTSKIPVMVLSNLGSREDMDRAMEMGAKEFFVKAHHTPSEIVATVKRIIAESYLKT